MSVISPANLSTACPVRRPLMSVGVCLAGAVAALSCGRPTLPPPDASVVRIGFTAAARDSAGELGVGQISWLITGEGLTRMDTTGRWELNLAERWTESGDGLTVTLTLARGLRFSDGSAVTASDVAASLDNSLRDPRAAFQYPTLRDVARVEVRDSRAVVLHLHRRSSMLADALSVPIHKGDGEGAPTTGAYLRAAASDGGTSFSANPHYHAGAPSIERVEQRNYASLRQAWASLMRGDIDFLYQVPPEARSFVERETSVQVFAALRPYVYTLAFNTRTPAFRDPDVRSALNYAVDRDAIVRLALHGRGRAAHGPIWPEHYAAGEAAQPRYHYDPARAHAMLTRAGVPATILAGSASGLRARLRFTCVIPRSPVHEHIALLLQKQFFDLGVDMRIQPVAPGDLVQLVTQGAYDAVLLDLASGPSLLRTYQFWHSSGAGSPFRFGGGEADTALDQLYGAPDEAAVKTAVRLVQARLHAAPPAIFLCWPEVARAVSRRFVVPAGHRDILATMWRWRPAGR